MSIFNEKQIKAMTSGRYICSECGSVMEFEDEWECTDGLYPTVTIRQIMWALKMKPIQRQRWETCFDRREI